MDYRMLYLGGGVRFYSATRMHVAVVAQVEHDKKLGLLSERANSDVMALEHAARVFLEWHHRGTA